MTDKLIGWEMYEDIGFSIVNIRARDLAFCPQCGWDVPIDEEGCCYSCGAMATGEAVDQLNKDMRELTRHRRESGTLAILQNEIDRLKEGTECHVARPGEGTYECNINKPCPACRLRVAEALVEGLRNELREAKAYSFITGEYEGGL